MKDKTLLVLLSTLITFMLVACGGSGGSSNGNSSESISAVSSDPLDSVDSVDETFKADSEVIEETLKTIQVDTLPAGEVRTIQVFAGNNATYSLRDNPTWMSIDSTTGIVTFSAPSDSKESYNFQVVADVEGVIKVSNVVSGQVESINLDLDDQFTNRIYKNLEDTGANVESVRTGITLTVPNKMNPASVSDNTWDVIKVYYQDYKKNIELVIIDGETGVIKKESIASGSWNQLPYVISKEGNLYIISNKADGKRTPVINIYNPQTNVLTLNAIALPSDATGTLYNKVRIATDGTMVLTAIYSNSASSSHGSPRYFEIDTATNTIINGSGEPLGFKAYPTALAADKDYLYFVLGITNSLQKAYKYSRIGKKLTEIAAAPANLNVAQTAYGVVLRNNDLYYFLHNDKKVLAEGNWRQNIAPWNFPEAFSDAQKIGTLLLPKNIVDYQLPLAVDIITKNSVPEEGQAELWIKQPNESTHKKYAYNVKTYGIKMNQIVKLKNGKILASGETYGPYLELNPVTGEYTQKGSIGLSGYTMLEYTKADGTDVVYMSGYPKGTLYEYDYNKPWTQSKHTWEPGNPEIDLKDQTLNPRWCGQFGFTGSGMHKALSSATGIDGYVYFGGQNIRSNNSGGLGWYNPNAGNGSPMEEAMDGLMEPFSNYAISNIVSIMGGAYLVISTIPVTDTVYNKPKASSGRLFLFDVKNKAVVGFNDPLVDLSLKTGDIIAADGPYIIGHTTDSSQNSYIYRVNMFTGRLDYRIQVERSYSGINRGIRMLTTNDKKILLFLKGGFATLDPISGKLTIGRKFIKDNNTKVWFEGAMSIVGDDVYMAGYDNILKAQQFK